MTTKKTKTKEAKERQRALVAAKLANLENGVNAATQICVAVTQPQAAELQNFAHHLAEAIRIARENPMIPASLYNGLADALIDFENDLPSLSRVSESESHIILTLTAFIEQTAERTEKGGKR
jgi:hypothetical protein